MYESLVSRLKSCNPGRDCTDCPMRYEEEHDSGIRSYCAAFEAGRVIRELSDAGSVYGRAWTRGYDEGKKENGVRWISVDEKLPQIEDGEIFSKDVYVTDGTVIARTVFAKTFQYESGSWAYTGIGEITHWCEKIPLP